MVSYAFCEEAGGYGESLEELAREAVQLQLAHRSPPKARALLKVLSKNTSNKPGQQASCPARPVARGDRS